MSFSRKSQNQYESETNKRDVAQIKEIEEETSPVIELNETTRVIDGEEGKMEESKISKSKIRLSITIKKKEKKKDLIKERVTMY